ncbi:hypothetical protein WT67_27585 [Burkholderia stagnalis]|nr:hypothetical protein WT17_26835 [Burkholderia stagnalis]KVO66967.1 hypothetical protein WT19_24560 [Burkholderia stagnalis]KVW59651.1 hypothetical protein WT28_20080 [Burkholderia stagnalis]KVW73931.1 hypothetical protein WT29_24765 [Burkholderia stagnalis]KVX66107.1 hypothetical protein WT34_27505 [Burkholderia stagnalis]
MGFESCREFRIVPFEPIVVAHGLPALYLAIEVDRRRFESPLARVLEQLGTQIGWKCFRQVLDEHWELESTIGGQSPPFHESRISLKLRAPRKLKARPAVLDPRAEQDRQTRQIGKPETRAYVDDASWQYPRQSAEARLLDTASMCKK